MSKRLSVIGLVFIVLVLTASVSNAQKPKPPKKATTAIGIYDVKSPEEIRKFSASEIRELIRIENGRPQGRGTIPHPVLIYCFEEQSFRYTGGKYKDKEIKYRLRTPETIRSDRTYPLVIFLHGRGQAESDNVSSLIHLHTILPLMIGPDQKDFFLLVAQCPAETPFWNFQSTKDGTLDVLMAAVEHVIAENPIDEKRITVTGVSGGGWGVWTLLSRYPDYFAGAVPTASGVPQQFQKLTELKRTPIWSFANKGDIYVDTKSIYSAMSVINHSGGAMALTECNSPGHNALRPALADYNSLQWMLAQKKGSWSPPPGVIVGKSKSFLLAFVMHLLPLAIIFFVLRNTIGEWVFKVRDSIWE